MQIRFFKMLGLVAAAVALVFVMIGAFFYLRIWNANPLNWHGMSKANNETKRIYLELVNDGPGNVKMLDVFINGGKQAKQVQLVISYTGHVPSFGIEDNELAEFVGIRDREIAPMLTGDVKAMIERNIHHPDDRTPIHYGLYLVSDEEIETVEIQYKYYGISKIKTIPVQEESSINDIS